MSQKEENVVEQPVVIDPFKYGYKPGTMLLVPAELFMENFQITGAVAHNETKEMVSINEFSPETGPEIDENGQVKPQAEKVIIYITPMGKKAGEAFNGNVAFHLEQIKSGMAVPVSELMNLGSQLDLD